MILASMLFWHFILASVSVDSARVENGRLVVDPIGISFEIPSNWLTKPTPLGGHECDPQSPQAGSINIDPTALRSMTGPNSYFADQYYSTLADSVFRPADLVAHLGAHGWRNCDNSVADLQMRVYVSDATTEAISERLGQARLSPYPGYSQPKVVQPRDSSGWHIDRADWVFNCGDCIFAERFEVYSRRIGERTASIVFMYTPAWREPSSDQRIKDLHTILRSLQTK